MKALAALAIVAALLPAGTPAPQGAPSPSGWELGLAFRADVAGAIVGVGYWRQPGETGQRVGKLWDATGSLAASAAFAGAADGWNWADFAAPVKAAAGSSWVASVNASPGPRYSVDAASAGSFSTGPLSPLGARFGEAEGAWPKWPSPNHYWRAVRFTPDDGPGTIELSGDEETGIFARLIGFARGAHDLTVTVDGVAAKRKVTIK